MVTRGNSEFFCAPMRSWRASGHYKEEARDDILGGVPMTAIAGQQHILTIQMEHITRSHRLSVQN
jgi:hypothetical protein